MKLNGKVAVVPGVAGVKVMRLRSVFAEETNVVIATRTEKQKAELREGRFSGPGDL